MTDLLTYAWAEITKAEQNADGDVMVEGVVASPSLDLDHQRMDPAFLKRAMPEWFKWANIREQHGPVAAGVGTEMTEQNDVWSIKALIVDKGAKEKVLKKVYKGFSIGVKHAQLVKSVSAPKGLVVGGNVVEVSLTDRPSNGDSKLTICKSAGGGLFVPTDIEGNEIMSEEQEFTGKWLTADLHKAALATADEVLSGDVEYGDTETAASTIRGLADLIIAEGMMLKSADFGGPVNIDNLRKANEALMHFVDSDVSDFPGGEDGMRAAFQEFLAKSATAENGDRGSLVAADLVKAVTQAQAPLMERIEALQEGLAEVRKTAIPGGPVTLVRTPVPVQRELTRAEFLKTEAQRPGFAPDIQDLLNKSAMSGA